MIADNDEDDTGSNEKHIFQQVVHDNLSRDWLLLYNQRTVDQIMNGKYLTDIHTVDQPITLHCNAGCTSTNKKRMFEKFSVWHNLKGITNFLSSKRIIFQYEVIYNNNDRGAVFTVDTLSIHGNCIIWTITTQKIKGSS